MRSACCETLNTVLIFLLLSLVPVIKKTWEKDALFLEYYSDHADPSIPTINLGVPNTERGKLSFHSLTFHTPIITCTGRYTYWPSILVQAELAN